MPKPTEQQLQIINSRFSQTQLTEDNCYVFSNLLIDNLPTTYYSIIQEPLLNKFAQDLEKGVALLLVHNNRKLPVGRSFNAYLKREYVAQAGMDVISLYGDFYIPLGINLEGGFTTDDVAKGIDTGINFATSIGFKAEKWTCSICGNDIRDYFACPHIPGKKYAVEKDGKDAVETCYVLVGEDGAGKLLEDSLVYAGACDRASVIRNFSADVTDFESSSKLQVIDTFKDIPVNALIYQYYTKDGSVLMTDTKARTGGSEYLRRRSEEQVKLDKIKEVLNKFDITFSSEDELENALGEKLSVKSVDVTELEKENQELKDQLSAKDEELSKVNSALSEKDEQIQKLEAENKELTEKAGLAETYKADLINQALEAGIRAQGNAFPKEMFNKFLSTLSIDEIKDVIKKFDTEFASKFEGKGVTDMNADDASKSETPVSKTDFETEQEFRDFIADEAMKYAQENTVSIQEATKIMYMKYSKESE
jgi:hypothetical protein